MLISSLLLISDKRTDFISYVMKLYNKYKKRFNLYRKIAYAKSQA